MGSAFCRRCQEWHQDISCLEGGWAFSILPTLTGFGTTVQYITTVTKYFMQAGHILWKKSWCCRKKYLTSVRRFSGDVRYCEIWGDFHSLAWEINFQLERLWFHDFAHLDFGTGLWWEMSLAVCLPGQSVCSRAVKSPVLPELSPACPALGSVCSTRERLHSWSWPWHQWAQESLK